MSNTIVSLPVNTLSSSRYDAAESVSGDARRYVLGFDSLRVRLFADLAAMTFRNKQVKEVSLWLCLKALDSQGHGYMPVFTAVDGLVDIFGYTRRTAYRHLAAGEGLFWHRFDTKQGSVIKIYGRKTVLTMNHTALLNKAVFIDYKPSEFDTAKKRRLAIWQTIYKPSDCKANPISQASVQEFTGIEARQQYRYNKQARVKKTVNFRPQHEQKRLPNIYHNRKLSGNTGMLKKLRQNLKSFKSDEAMKPRTYFHSMRAIIKTSNKTDVVYQLVRSTKRHIHGRLEWQPVITLEM